MNMGLKKISVVVVATGALLAVPSAFAGTLPKIPIFTGTPSSHDFQVEPSSITYTGDGSGFFAGGHRPHSHRARSLKWKSWTANGASGSGFNWLNNCRPDCAHGKFTLYPVTLKLSRPRHEHHHLVFTRMNVTYTGSKPGRVKHRELWKLVFSSGTWSWTFPIQ